MDRASFSMLLPGPPAAPATDGLPVAQLARVARYRIRPSAASPRTTARGRWAGSGSRAIISSRSTPRSMMTNKNSTTMAPA